MSCCGNAMPCRTGPDRSVAYPCRAVPCRAVPCHAMSHHNQHPSPLSPFLFRTTFHKNASRWKCCGGLIIKPEPLERQIKRFPFVFSKWNWCSRQCNFRDACRLGWDLETPDERGERRLFSHFSSTGSFSIFHLAQLFLATLSTAFPTSRFRVLNVTCLKLY